MLGVPVQGGEVGGLLGESPRKEKAWAVVTIHCPRRALVLESALAEYRRSKNLVGSRGVAQAPRMSYQVPARKPCRCACCTRNRGSGLRAPSGASSSFQPAA